MFADVDPVDPLFQDGIFGPVLTGTIGVNWYLPDLTAPFGGVKSSGLGRELGQARLGELPSRSEHLPRHLALAHTYQDVGANPYHGKGRPPTMRRLDSQEISAVRDALRSSHRQLATFAKTIPQAERTRRSYCTEWTVAQVYSHLGSGAEIGLAHLRAALEGTSPADTKTIWKPWDALAPDQMISGFEVADNQYLDALDRLDLGDAGDLVVQLDAQLRVPVDVSMVLRLAERALHSWDVYVAFDPNAEVNSHAADLLVDLYPRELISMFATRLMAGRIGQACLRIDIGSTPKTFVMTIADSVILETTDPSNEPACTGHLRLPTSDAWTRLLTGRLDDDHMPTDVTSTGTCPCRRC